MTRKEAGKCIFCGGGGLTKEHIFADWMRALLPRTPSDMHTHGRIGFGVDEQGEVQRLLATKKRQGSAASKKLRVVCRCCNNGWMSRLDEAAKPIILRLAQAEAFTLGQEDAHTLSGCLAKMTMVAEFQEPSSVIARQVERAYLKRRGIPPPTWSIWIGLHGDPGWITAIHHMVSRANDHVSTGMGDAQSTTIGIGGLLALVVSQNNDDYPHGLEFRNNLLHEIWPEPPERITWPPQKGIGPGGPIHYANQLAQFLGLPKPFV